MSVLGTKKRPQGTFDSELEFKDAGAVTSSAAAQVDSADKIVDLGTGLFKGCMIVEVTAAKISDSDEVYHVAIQLSSNATFANTFVTPAKLELGKAAVLYGDQDVTTGRYKVYFDNEHNGTFYRYARLYTHTAGTSESINYSAYCIPAE